jgi:ABC-2 type transport system permease protein
MIGNTGDKFSWVGNLSLYNLFQSDKLIEGASSAYLGMAAFVIIAAVLYGSSITIFNKRDLHI